MKRIDRLVNRGRRIETTSIRGFVQLYLISALRPWRRKLLRHSEEMAHVEAWLALARQHLASNYRLAEGIITARRLIKGYSDAHAHGLSKYDRVLSAVPLWPAATTRAPGCPASSPPRSRMRMVPCSMARCRPCGASTPDAQMRRQWCSHHLSI